MRIILLLGVLIFTAFSSETVDNNVSKIELQERYKEPQRLVRGQFFEDVRVDILYGFQMLGLDISAKVEDADIKDSDGNAISLTDAGNYEFDSIMMESKDIILTVGETSVSYKEQGNDPTKADKDDLLVEINEFIAGYGQPSYVNTLLNHKSDHQLIIRKANFKGNYTRGSYRDTFEMDKTKYSYKFMDNTGLARVFSRYIGGLGGKEGSQVTSSGNLLWSYWQFDYEKSTLPQVIYTTATNGNDLDFIDTAFETTKYTIIGGKDIIFIDVGIIAGYRLGLGMSDIELSDNAKFKVAQDGVSNLDTSYAMNYQIALKLGYTKKLTFDYTEFEVNILYDFEYFAEVSSDTVSDEDDNGKAELVYDRAEMLHALTFNARWRF